jgi:hypothetical protein
MADHNPNADLRHYSQRIKYLRKILPLLAAGLLLLLALAANPDLRRALAPPPQDNDRLRIDRPVFSGRLADLRPYHLTATQGRQKADGMIALQAPDLLIDADKADGRLQLTAANADYRTDTGFAFLRGDVRMQDAPGNIVSGDIMQADLNRGTITASAVTMNGPSGRLKATSMRADTKTRHYRFAEAVMRLKEPVK